MQVLFRLFTRIIGVFFCVLTVIICFAQDNDVKTVYYKLTTATSPSASLPVSSIIVQDVRFDTSGAGLEESASQLRMVQLKNGLRFGIAQFLGSHLATTPSSQLTLHCFIKKLMLSNHIYVNSPEDQRITSKKFDASEQSGILFTAEFYLEENNQYIPVVRFDTTLTGARKINSAGESYMEAALTACANKVAQTDWNKLRNQGRKLQPAQLNEYYATRLALPVLGTGTPAKGIYVTFDDFRNNKPQDIEFSVDKGSKGDFLYIKNEKGEQILQNELWGYSDGKDMFIYSASNYFKLERNGNGFIIYGAKDFSARRVMRLNFSALSLATPNSNMSKGQTRTKYRLDQSFLQLDMETGELF